MDAKQFITDHPYYEQAKSMRLSHPYQAEMDVLDIDPASCQFRIGFRLRERMTDLGSYLANTTHVMTHSPVTSGSLRVSEYFDRIVYILRDPRDVAVSMARFAFTPHMLENDPHGIADETAYLASKSADLARDWVKHVAGFLRFRNRLGVHFVFYENLLDDSEGEVAAMFKYFSLDLEPGQIRQIMELTSFDKMRDDAPQHVRKGKSLGWTDVLSAAQAERIDRVCGPMLDLLGYPKWAILRNGQVGSVARRRLPANPTSEEIERALLPAKRTLAQFVAYGFRQLLGPRPACQKLRMLRQQASRFGELLWKLG